jgi:glycosyltransferase involved in cell wall biosynthesis
MSVVVSAGFHKTHVTIAAREAHARGALAVAITGAYPTERVVRALGVTRAGRRGRVARLLERGEGIPASELTALAAPELLYEVFMLLLRVPLLRRAVPHLLALTFRIYGRAAARRLARAEGAGVYHFRAGFGQGSLARARRLGMITLCDQTLAHPLLLRGLLTHRGRVLDAATEALTDGETQLDAIDRAVVRDINEADAVLVNSDFVKQTFTALGGDPERVHVVYLGVDDNFLRAVGPTGNRATSGPLRLLFAGRLEPRKGADTLVEALSELDDIPWELRVAGPVATEVAATHGPFLADRRVRQLGTLPRPELVREMLAAPVFVFPSYAEGSARVVFEAMACGCYVITSPNAGSIVEDGVHGALVEPWDVDGFRRAVRAAADDPERAAQIGRHNAELVRTRFRQCDYGDALLELYSNLVAAKATA